ncbi:MAG: hypothetical protein E7020_02835 [Alphaproteobacteria bacterium]|nr:hypothetical protein [Alphaproteobacteria bacterium]
MFDIGTKVTKKNYTKAAIWCNKNNATINPLNWQIETLNNNISINEIKAKRALLYFNQIDPITSQISRLKDELSNEIIAAKIEYLINLRAYKIAVIKSQNPYPTEEIEDAR